jgi:metal-responsive CopG/Arc/MetJ family transcriptional regulator
MINPKVLKRENFWLIMVDDYITVSLPKSLIRKIDETIKNTDLGYKSRPEFIKDSVRRLFEQLNVPIADIEQNEE